MKIAILSFYSGIENRGVETLVHELSKRFAKKNEVFVFQSGKKVSTQTYQVIQFKSPTSRIQKEGILKKLFLDFNSLLILLFTLRCFPCFVKQKFDIIFPLNNGWQSILCKVYCFFSSSRFVFSGQSGLGWDDRLNLYLNPDVFIALTEKNKNWAQSINSKAKIVKIPNGVDLKNFNSRITPKQINLKKPLVISIAALIPSKRLELAIQAVSRLSNVSLLLLGEGHLKNKLQKLGLKLLGKKRFKIISCAHQQVPPYLKCAQVFTLPSIPQESFGIAIVEALAVNLPAIVTNDPSRREIVGNAGFFIDPKNITQYKEKLKKAINDNWGEKPRNQAKKFSWDAISQKYEKLFLEITHPK